MLVDAYRPSHADYTYEKVLHSDHRGSGRASARSKQLHDVAAGAVAMQMPLKVVNISVNAYVSGVGNVSIPENTSIDTTQTYNNILRCPHEATALLMQRKIEETAQTGDTLGRNYILYY